MRALLCFTALALPLAALADGVMVDSKVTSGVAVLTAKTEAKNIVWIDKDDGLIEVVPADALKDSKTRVVTGKPGRYRVLAVGVAGEKPTWGEVSFTIGTPEPPPIPPLPVPPQPVDDFAKRLADAYAADMSPWKRAAVKELRAIFTVMAKHARDDKDIVTSRQLAEVLADVKKDRIPDANVLLVARQLIAARVAAAVGTPSDAPFDRERVAAVFESIVAALPVVE